MMIAPMLYGVGCGREETIEFYDDLLEISRTMTFRSLPDDAEAYVTQAARVMQYVLVVEAFFDKRRTSTRGAAVRRDDAYDITDCWRRLNQATASGGDAAAASFRTTANDVLNTIIRNAYQFAKGTGPLDFNACDKATLSHALVDAFTKHGLLPPNDGKQSASAARPLVVGLSVALTHDNSIDVCDEVRRACVGDYHTAPEAGAAGGDDLEEAGTPKKKPRRQQEAPPKDNTGADADAGIPPGSRGGGRSRPGKTPNTGMKSENAVE